MPRQRKTFHPPPITEEPKHLQRRELLDDWHPHIEFFNKHGWPKGWRKLFASRSSPRLRTDVVHTDSWEVGRRCEMLTAYIEGTGEESAAIISKWFFPKLSTQTFTDTHPYGQWKRRSTIRIPASDWQGWAIGFERLKDVFEQNQEERYLNKWIHSVRYGHDYDWRNHFEVRFSVHWNEFQGYYYACKVYTPDKKLGFGTAAFSKSVTWLRRDGKVRFERFADMIEKLRDRMAHSIEAAPDATRVDL